jgi:TonB-linked SusC/RagA family outer membrane protein
MKEAKHLKKLQFGRLALLLIATVFAFGTVNAQTRTVTGVVKDPAGETIIGASVQVKGTKIATITGMDGSFKINVPTDAKTLVISYVGMDKKELPIAGSVVNVKLENSDKTLDEVVVVGYGTQKKRDLTGSVSSIGEKALKDIPVSNIAEALTGKLTGVQVTTTEGSPDAEIKIRVRGGGSITQANTPLYIVDGFAKDDIRDISPADIQSIDVLKDASSTAIYGSRGANGVILITTKSGQQGKLSVSYNGYMGMKQVSKTLDVLTPFQYTQKQYERASWGGASTVVSEYEKYFGNYGDIDLYNYMNGTNWQNETFGRTGVTQNHTVSLNGGSKTFNYNASYSHIYDKAIMYMSDYVRDNFSVKLKYTPVKWLKLDFNTRYAGTIINGSGANDQTGIEKSTNDSRVKSAVVFTPIPLKNLATQGDDSEATSNLYSPIVSSQDNNRYQASKDFSINGGITVNFMKDFSFNTTLGYSSNFKNDKRFYGLSAYYTREGGAKKRNDVDIAPSTFLTETNKSTIQNTNVLNYKKDNLFEGHNLSAVLGQETLIRKNDNFVRDIEQFPTYFMSDSVWSNLAAGTERSAIRFFAPDYRLISVFGRLNYDIEGKYLISAVLRSDGSSKFAKGNAWGFFPSVSAGWRISDEEFMKSTENWLSNLKLRVGYGQAGNDNIDDGAFYRSYKSSLSPYLDPTDFSYIYTTGSTLANPNLKWETTITQNVGLDFGFFKGRINGTLEMYSNKTLDALMLVNISGTGYETQWQNVASTSNNGVELSLNADLVQTKDFNLGISFNISANQNKVIKMSDAANAVFNEAWTSYTEASNSYIVSVGNPVGLIYGFQSDGMYAADDFMWNGNKWIMNSAKYTTSEITGYNGSTPIYKYKDADGNVFADNSAIDGLSFGPGGMKLKDLNKDGVIDLKDKTLIGNANPKYFGAFGLTSSYKNFDMSANFNWVYGNDIYNANKIEMNAQFFKYRNMLTSSLNSYTQIDWASGARITDKNALSAMNANATMWAAPTGRYATTSWAIEDGSFLRLNNLTVGYTLPGKLTKKFYVQKLRIYASGYNLWVWTKYSGYDPEVDSRRKSPATPGVDYSAYPKSRSYNVGVNLTF